MIRAFVAGMMTGGLVVTMFGERILRLIDAKTRAARLRAAATAGHVAEQLERGLTGEDRERGAEPRP